MRYRKHKHLCPAHRIRVSCIFHMCQSKEYTKLFTFLQPGLQILNSNFPCSYSRLKTRDFICRAFKFRLFTRIFQFLETKQGTRFLNNLTTDIKSIKLSNKYVFRPAARKTESYIELNFFLKIYFIANFFPYIYIYTHTHYIYAGLQPCNLQLTWEISVHFDSVATMQRRAWRVCCCVVVVSLSTTSCDSQVQRREKRKHNCREYHEISEMESWRGWLLFLITQDRPCRERKASNFTMLHKEVCEVVQSERGD